MSPLILPAAFCSVYATLKAAVGLSHLGGSRASSSPSSLENSPNPGSGRGLAEMIARS
jgi:hypothetical protein